MITPARDPVVVVTDGACAIDRELVRRLARRNCAIVLVYLADQSAAEAAVEEILAARGTAVTLRADLTDDLDVDRLFTETIAEFGGVDAVVHTTARGTSLLYRHAARHLPRGSPIVSVSTAGGITPALAQQLSDRGITINGVPPGLEPPGADHDVADLVAFLDRGRHRPAG